MRRQRTKTRKRAAMPARRRKAKRLRPLRLRTFRASPTGAEPTTIVSRLGTYYDLLAAIYERPWLVKHRLTSLQDFLVAFDLGLAAADRKLFPGKPPIDELTAFLARRHGETRNLGWLHILLDLADGDEKVAFALFFEEVDNYRELDGAAPMFRG